jgi:demethylmenaquinone methyltransferase/2-methoxy-6-polyprenyl-1,4-benzoquinol methylase
VSEHRTLISFEQNARDPSAVRQLFSSIAERYDLANHILSCGFDFSWRKRAAEIIALWRPNRIADLATGTGDLAFAIAEKSPDAEIIGIDFSEDMLAIARRKGLSKTIVADAMQLPFPDGSFDCVTVAFGLRNMKDWNAALREMSRVLQRNGHLLVLEFSLPRLSILRTVYRFYLHRCLPFLGSFLTRKKTAYNYLGDSIEEFPNDTAMRRMLEAISFGDVAVEPLTGGIVTIFTAEKL